MHDWQDAEDYAQLASQHAQRGQWRHAIDAMRAALAINPERAGWHLLLGRALEQTGYIADALASYRAADDLAAGDVRTLLLMAGAYGKLERWVDVIDTCEKVQAIDAGEEACYCPRVAAYAALDEHDKAEEMFYLGRLCTDECVTCLEYLGDSWAARGHAQSAPAHAATTYAATAPLIPTASAATQRAMEVWRRALELPDAPYEIHYKLADELRRSGQLELARARYLAALRDTGRRDTGRRDTGRRDSGRRDAAMRDGAGRDAVRGNTGRGAAERAETLLRLAELLLEMGRGVEAGERLMQVGPSHRDTARWHFLAARVAQDEVKVPEAIGIQEFGGMDAGGLALRALELDPTFPRAHLLLAELSMAGGRLAAARRHLRRELLLEPAQPDLLRDLMARLLEARVYRAAVKCGRRLVRLEPHSASAWQDLAVACFQRHRYDEGVAASLESLSREPGNVAVMHNLALAMERLGRYNEAMRWVKLALDVDPRHAALRRLSLRVRVMLLVSRRPRVRRLARQLAQSVRRLVRRYR